MCRDMYVISLNFRFVDEQHQLNMDTEVVVNPMYPPKQQTSKFLANRHKQVSVSVQNFIALPFYRFADFIVFRILAQSFHSAADLRWYDTEWMAKLARPAFTAYAFRIHSNDTVYTV